MYSSIYLSCHQYVSNCQSMYVFLSLSIFLSNKQSIYLSFYTEEGRKKDESSTGKSSDHQSTTDVASKVQSLVNVYSVSTITSPLPPSLPPCHLFSFRGLYYYSYYCYDTRKG